MWHETGHRAEVTCILRSPQKDTFAVGYADGSIRVWSASSSSVVATFNGHKKAVTALAFDETGTRLASGSQDTDLILWDVVGEAGLYRCVLYTPGVSLLANTIYQFARTPRPNYRDSVLTPGRGVRAFYIYRHSSRVPLDWLQRHIPEVVGPFDAALHSNCRCAPFRGVDYGS